MPTLKVGSIAALHRYPVKSMMGEELNATRIGAKGVRGDRSFALADPETGKIASAKNPSKWPNLFQFRAAFTRPGRFRAVAAGANHLSRWKHRFDGR